MIRAALSPASARTNFWAGTSPKVCGCAEPTIQPAIEQSRPNECIGSWEIRVRPAHALPWPASGRARSRSDDDERGREVGLRHRSCDAANKADDPQRRWLEQRAMTKGMRITTRAPGAGRKRVQQALERNRQAAKQRKDRKPFTTLFPTSAGCSGWRYSKLITP